MRVKSSALTSKARANKSWPSAPGNCRKVAIAKPKHELWRSTMGGILIDRD
jgi:hypothetical protein